MLRNNSRKKLRAFSIGLLASASILSTNPSSGLERTLRDIDYSRNGRIEQEDLFYLSNHWKGTGNQEKSPEELIYLIDNWKSEYELETPTPTITQTSTPTPSSTLTPTLTETYTLTPTDTNTITYTSTLTPTPTNTLTNTKTNTLTPTITKTNTKTPTLSSTPTNTNTITNTPTLTFTYTPTNTFTQTLTSTPTPFYTPIPLETMIVDLPNLPENARKMKMIKVPAGSFMTGAMPDEQFTDNWDYPQHQVNIGYDFYMQETETTQAQYFAVMGAWPPRSPPLEKYGIGDNYPIYFVNWKDSKNFMAKLSEITGKTFRLPSEAEFEYAHRARTNTRFYFGNSPDCVEREYIYDQEGNILDWNDICANCSAELGGTRATYIFSCFNANKAQEVGILMYNQFGLYDMSGNVSEYCLDSFYWTYEGAPTDGSAWIDPNDTENSFRIIKSGSFDISSLYGRIPKRMGAKGYAPYVGFRTVSSDVNKVSYSDNLNKIENKDIEEDVNAPDFQLYLNSPTHTNH